MRKSTIISGIALLGVLLIGNFASSEQPADRPTTQPVRQPPLFARVSEMKWQKMDPELDGGPEIAILHIDPTTGATELMIRSREPLRVPPHFHSANETHTVIKGQQVYECGGHRESLSPGDFNFIPARDPHRAWLSADAIVFITVDGPWDVNWLNGPPTKADLGDAAVADVLKP